MSRNDVETRQHISEPHNAEWIFITCPFCSRRVLVNKWYLSQSDSACQCLAKHTRFGTSYRKRKDFRFNSEFGRQK